MTYPTTPILLYNSQFRHYRMRMKNNSFRKIQQKIYTPEQLKKLLDALMPQDVYQTVSWWMRPESLTIKPAKIPYPTPDFMLTEMKVVRHLDNFFIGSDFLMDFDKKDYKDQKEMLDNVQLARLFLTEKGMKEFTLMKTPSGGRQLLVTDFNKWVNKQTSNPLHRENLYGWKMNKLVKLLKGAGVKWDDEVSLDTRRIFRVPNTVGGAMGNRVQLIEFKEELLIFAR